MKTNQSFNTDYFWGVKGYLLESVCVKGGFTLESIYGNPLQYSCLENSMDRGAWWAIDHRVTKSQLDMTEKEILSLSFFQGQMECPLLYRLI